MEESRLLESQGFQVKGLMD
ncbi:MAG: hypothetical protein EZS28_021279, partial [Streblomastix strix]